MARGVLRGHEPTRFNLQSSLPWMQDGSYTIEVRVHAYAVLTIPLCESTRSRPRPS